MTAETAARVLAGGGVKRAKAEGGGASARSSSNGSSSNGSSGGVSTHSNNARKVGARGPMAKPVDPDAQWGGEASGERLREGYYVTSSLYISSSGAAPAVFMAAINLRASFTCPPSQHASIAAR